MDEILFFLLAIEMLIELSPWLNIHYANTIGFRLNNDHAYHRGVYKA